MQVSRRLNFFSHLCLRRLSCWGWCSAHIPPQPPAGSQLVIDFLQTGLDDVKCNFPLYYRKVLLFLSLFFYSSCFLSWWVYFFLLFPDGWMDGEVHVGENLGNISCVFRSNIESPGQKIQHEPQPGSSSPAPHFLSLHFLFSGHCGKDSCIGWWVWVVLLETL